MSIVQDLVPLFAANAHALRYFDQKKQKWNYRKIGRPIMPALITQHISRGDPEFSLGAYVLRDLENSKGHALILDLDDHDGDAGALITETAVKLCTILEELALPCLLFRSGGGKGFHVYLLFEELQTKSWLRALGKFLVGEKLGMAEGASGVGSGQIEIFPTPDELRRKWDRDLKPKCSPASFWLAAKKCHMRMVTIGSWRPQSIDRPPVQNERLPLSRVLPPVQHAEPLLLHWLLLRHQYSG